MQRIDAQEILDSGTCSHGDAQGALAVLGRMNRWFGGVTTTRKMVERVAMATGEKTFSVLEVAAGLGEVPAAVTAVVARKGITLDVTLLDRAANHLPAHSSSTPLASPRSAKLPASRKLNRSRLVADALALPFADDSFDLVSCSLFTHHLNTQPLAQFVREGLRVSRRALLINDLIRNPIHLGLVFASLPIMRNRVAWLDGLTSVRRAYVPKEIRGVLESAISCEVRAEISCHYLYRMAIIVWKQEISRAA